MDLVSSRTGPPGTPGQTGEAYERVIDNSFLSARHNPLSTFAIDVDTAAYSNVRRFLYQNQKPFPDAVRIEELVNYFPYEYPAPTGEHPFSVTAEIASCPWNPEHRLARIGLKGREVADKDRPATNLVFLIDVSGSMNAPNRLPLVKRGLRMLVERMPREQDRIAIVVYAGQSGLALASTSCDRQQTILESLGRLEAGGSTNGGQGIQLAYKVARDNFIPGGVNRVILCTDGDFNVGITDRNQLVDLIQKEAKSGVFLTVLGFGMGNLKDATLEQLANKGNGQYAYIDNISEAQKVLVEQMGGTLVTIAKDVKIQVDFNPNEVYAYRLIGYENRLLKAEDFKDDTKDAGEIGAGHTVTALYELVPPGVKMDLPVVEGTKYQTPGGSTPAATSGQAFTVRLAYKPPDGDKSTYFDVPVTDGKKKWDDASGDFKFAASVAGFGMLLRDSKYKGKATGAVVRDLARRGQGNDRNGYRGEFLGLIDAAERLTGEKK